MFLKKIAHLVFIGSFFVIPSLALSFVIHKKPIPFSKKRIELSKEYQKKHYLIENPSIKIKPKMIIIHWTALNSFTKSYFCFISEELRAHRKDLNTSNLGVSAHFLVDRDGAIYQLMPDNFMARHCIGLNHLSIGIENVGGEKGEENLTEAQLRSNFNLVCYLKKKYPEIEYLIGHYEYQKFENTPLFKEVLIGYRTHKQDPGPKFMTILRKKLAPLKLKSSF